MKKKSIRSYIVGLGALLLTFGPNVFSEEVQKLKTPTPKVGTLFDFVTEVLKIVIKIGLPVIVIMFIISGYQFVTAQGDTKKLEEARRFFYGTVIGAAIIMCAVLVATIVKNTIGQLGG